MSTNLTDDDSAGHTTTTLVDSSDRGSTEFNTRVGTGVPQAPAVGPGLLTQEQTVDEVVDDVDAGKLTAQEALDAERAGKNRSTLISQLESRGGQ